MPAKAVSDGRIPSARATGGARWNIAQENAKYIVVMHKQISNSAQSSGAKPEMLTVFRWVDTLKNSKLASSRNQLQPRPLTTRSRQGAARIYETIDWLGATAEPVFSVNAVRRAAGDMRPSSSRMRGLAKCECLAVDELSDGTTRTRDLAKRGPYYHTQEAQN